MRDYSIAIYDRGTGERRALLKNAMDVGYTLTKNALWTARFSLPADDPKNDHCKSFNYVEVFDGDERIELFRILPQMLTRNEQAVITYECEHVVATLIDRTLFQNHQLDNLTTTQVLRYLLDRQYTRQWQLGDCDFSSRFSYHWENTNTLAALFSVPEPFADGYNWTYDTTATPWRISLKREDPTVKAEIRYRKNMVGITKTTDPTTYCTRLYGLGYGEGDNQLTVAHVNGGVPYIDAIGIDPTNPIEQLFVDVTIEDPVVLLARMRTLITKLSQPYMSYTVDALDLFRATGDSFGKFRPGDMVRIVDGEDGIEISAPIVSVSKDDVVGDPAAVTITIANAPEDAAANLSSLEARQRIGEVYAQGATNLMTYTFADNADTNYPARIRIVIPAECRRINKLMLNFVMEAFRAYETGAASGGASSVTSKSGGGETTGSGGGTYTSTEGGGATQVTQPGQTSGASSKATSDYTGSIDGNTAPAQATPGTPFSTDYAGTPEHRHSAQHRHVFSSPSHSHGMAHTHSVPGFTVNVPSHTHSVNVPAHTHSTQTHSHDISIPAHTHSILYGIYTGPRASGASLRIDGQVVGSVATNTDIDIIPWLSKDDAGRVRRGGHTIEIIPTGLTRIEATAFMQVFVQSRGVGDF